MGKQTELLEKQLQLKDKEIEEMQKLIETLEHREAQNSETIEEMSKQADRTLEMSKEFQSKQETFLNSSKLNTENEARVKRMDD